MTARFETKGIVPVKPNEMAELVTGTLERLGYQNIRYAKLRAEFTAADKGKQLIDTDHWYHNYRIRLSWKPASEGSLVTVKIEEKEGSVVAVTVAPSLLEKEDEDEKKKVKKKDRKPTKPEPAQGTLDPDNKSGDPFAPKP